jgi:hypothetical protein
MEWDVRFNVNNKKKWMTKGQIIGLKPKRATCLRIFYRFWVISAMPLAAEQRWTFRGENNGVAVLFQ